MATPPSILAAMEIIDRFKSSNSQKEQSVVIFNGDTYLLTTTVNTDYLITNIYLTKNGDDLSNIAKACKPDGTSLNQFIVAIFTLNPDAFNSENMNNLKAGVSLSIPSEAYSNKIERVEAALLIRQHSRAFERKK